MSGASERPGLTPNRSPGLGEKRVARESVRDLDRDTLLGNPGFINKGLVLLDRLVSPSVAATMSKKMVKPYLLKEDGPS